jgi:GT2 family glycosyltransferase
MMTITNAEDLCNNPKPKVSVVSLAYNRRENVRELLTALRHQSYPSFEIILVDNASPDGTAEMVKQEFPEVHLIEAGGNLGMVAYNLGFEAVRGNYILVMDDDGLPGSDEWIEQVVAHFEANPRLAVVSCTIRLRDTGQIARDSQQFVPQGNLTDGYPTGAFNGTGAGLRAEALQEVGYYPVHFYRTYLEFHLCTRLVNAGWEARHFPQLEVWHSRPSGTSRRPVSYYGIRNYYWYVWEFYPWRKILYETTHRTGYYLKMGIQKKIAWRDLLKGSVDALRGLGQSLRQRHPISEATLEYLRWVRRHGNWHGIAPGKITFTE